MDSPAIAQHMFPSSPSPVSRVTGFVVATAAQSKRSPRVFAREPSLLSLNLASSSFGSSKVADTESEGSECTEHLDSDFEDDFACPAGRGIPIVQRDDHHYKMMLRVRAVVNARLYQSQAAQQQQQPQCPQRHQPRAQH